MFYWRATIRARDDGPGIEAAFTDRAANRGAGPYAGLNLGGHVGDDPDAVEANRAALATALGVTRERLLFLNQVHGTDVVEASGPWAGEAPEADGIVSRTSELALAVLVADCVPVLLHDVEAGVVGAVHAGRPGLLGGIVPRAVAAMRDLGARQPAAIVGPSVCGRCYEVPEEMALAAAAVAPTSQTSSWTGTPAIDVAAGVTEQLASAGVAVQRVAGCTREDEQLYSYRRDGTTGRLAGVVVAHAAGAR
ncbi:peptidoglycan editing factor PgeF [Intrasporangium sp.]|uniref:peptidoglycan editing factor PgeF n=1 Tax=Intrasporangium sp. TaxID=1925024 RepID=UPI0029399802|nr:peptidoglycan editing factor PgeF [Intrasporangium sp.]MDV3223327.1 peptidoglycan editing factor PgeF [Intrasporangium sp.]